MELFSFICQVVLWALSPVLIGLILLQGGAGDVSSAFGGGGMLDSTLGVGANRKLAKITGWLAVVFFAIVLFLAIPRPGHLGTSLATGGGATAIGPAKPAPAAPATAATALPVAAHAPQAPATRAVEAVAPAATVAPAAAPAAKIESVPAPAATVAPAPAPAATPAGTATGG